MCGKVFTVLKIGHFFCPFFKTLDILWQKNNFPQHKVFLACGHKKKQFSICYHKFLIYFYKTDLGVFFVSIIY